MCPQLQPVNRMAIIQWKELNFQSINASADQPILLLITNPIPPATLFWHGRPCTLTETLKLKVGEELWIIIGQAILIVYLFSCCLFNKAIGAAEASTHPVISIIIITERKTSTIQCSKPYQTLWKGKLKNRPKDPSSSKVLFIEKFLSDNFKKFKYLFAI